MILMKKVQDSLQEAADILGITYATATKEEQSLIIEICQHPKHELDWFLSIGVWKGYTKQVF